MAGDKTPIRPQMAERLKDEMDGMDRHDLANEAHVGYGLIGHILAGRRALVRDKAEALGEYFGVRPEYLMGEDDFRTEDEYLKHIQGRIAEGTYIPTISESAAFDVLCSYFGIREESQFIEGSYIYKITAGSKEYYIDAEQKKTVREMIENTMKTQIFSMYALLQPGNEFVKRQYMKSDANNFYDDRPAAEILAEVEQIRKNPDTQHIYFGGEDNGKSDNH